MANNEFKRIEEFIDGFTRNGPTPENYIYDGTFWGIDFCFRDKYYRITRDTFYKEKELQKRFRKSENAEIQFFETPKDEYPNIPDIPDEMYLGIFEDVYDLIDNGKIDGIPLREILVSEETEILGMD